MFLVVRTPRKTVGPVSHKIGGHKRRGWMLAWRVLVVSGIRFAFAVEIEYSR